MALQRLAVGSVIDAWQPNGDFVLPSSPREKLVFIAGGIGITPFRSMIKYLLDTGQRRDIVVLYTAAAPANFAFREVLAEARESLGVKVEYILPEAQRKPSGWVGRIGYITPQMLGEIASDFTERTFYLAGPPAMVRAYRAMLRRAGISRRRIKTDFFAGY
jgi:ferredoxin-NADP reductase